jgi:methionyl-tRNA formyltransferase
VEFSFGTVALREFARGNNVTLVRRGTPSLFERCKFAAKFFLAQFSDKVKEHTKDVVGQAAYQLGVSVKWTRSVNSPDFIDWLKSQKADLIAVAGFSQILKPATINAARFAVNFHPSLLPAYRGPSPSYWIIKNRERESGVSCHILEPGIDSGNVLFHEAFSVPPEMTAEQHEERAAQLCAPLVRKLLLEIEAGTPRGEPQDESRSSYYGFPPGS